MKIFSKIIWALVSSVICILFRTDVYAITCNESTSGVGTSVSGDPPTNHANCASIGNMKYYNCTTDNTYIQSYECTACNAGYSLTDGLSYTNTENNNFYQLPAFTYCRKTSDCKAGEHENDYGSCSACTAGYYCPGNDYMYQCPAGTYSEKGASRCTECSTSGGQTTSSAGSTSSSACFTCRNTGAADVEDWANTSFDSSTGTVSNLCTVASCKACDVTNATCSVNETSSSCTYTSSCGTAAYWSSGTDAACLQVKSGYSVNTRTLQCEPKTFTATFYADPTNNNSAKKTQSVTYKNESVRFPSTEIENWLGTAISKTGYIFEYVCPVSGTPGTTSASVPWNADTCMRLYSNTASVGNSCTTQLRAVQGNWAPHWAPLSYSAKYSCGDGSFAGDNTADSTTHTFYYDSSYTLKSGDICKRTGYTFNGWNLNGTTYKSGAKGTWKWADNVTFTAKWTPNVYNLTFDPKNGTLPYNHNCPTTHTYGTDTIIPSTCYAIPSAQTQTFYRWGWTSLGTGDDTSLDAENPKIGATEIITDKTLYAQYEAMVSVPFDPNGGIFEGDTYSQVFYQNYPKRKPFYLVPQKDVTRTDHELMGWNCITPDTNGEFLPINTEYEWNVAQYTDEQLSVFQCKAYWRACDKNCTITNGTCSYVNVVDNICRYNMGCNTGYSPANADQIYLNQFTCNPWEITLKFYNGISGTSTYLSQTTATWGESLNRIGTSLTNLTDTYYNFDGYVEAKTAGTNNEVKYYNANGSPALNVFKPSTNSDISLMAKWVGKTEDVNIINVSGVTQTVWKTVSMQHGESLPIIDEIPTGSTSIVTAVRDTIANGTGNVYYTPNDDGTGLTPRSGTWTLNELGDDDSKNKLYVHWSACTACAGNEGVNCSIYVENNTCKYTTSCQEGYYGLSHNNGYNATCTKCLAGYYCTGGTRYKCEKGTANPNTGQSSCPKCGDWEYQDEEGKSSCKSCPTLTTGTATCEKADKSTGKTAASQCVQHCTPQNCASGTTTQSATNSTTWGAASVVSGKPLLAKAGYYVDGVVCSACGAGQYGAGGTAECATCAAGSYTLNTEANTECTPCNKQVDGILYITSNTGAYANDEDTACDQACSNTNISKVTEWFDNTWNNTNNTLSPMCRISTCADGYQVSAASDHNACEPKKYTLSYTCGDGTLLTNTPPDDSDKEYESSFTPSATTVCARVGHSFDKWRVMEKDDAGKLVPVKDANNNEVKLAAETATTWVWLGAITLVPDWQVKEYTITYKPTTTAGVTMLSDSGEWTTVEDANTNIKTDKVKYYADFTSRKSDNSFKRTGYSLDKWVIADDKSDGKKWGELATGTSYNLNFDTSGNFTGYEPTAADLTFKAQWGAKKYTITLDADCTTGVTEGTTSLTVTFDEKVDTIKPPSCPGYVFAGYKYGDSTYFDNTGKPDDDTTWTTASDVTMTAQWTPCGNGYYCPGTEKNPIEQNPCPAGATTDTNIASKKTQCILKSGTDGTKFCISDGNGGTHCFNPPANIPYLASSSS